jgi:sugar lactone lactonase YvrE
VALEGPGAPDGLAVDAVGDVWVAVWGGSSVRRYSPDGRVTGVVAVAASHTSSCAFAGDDLATLVITTAQDELSAEQLAAEPDAGRLFTAVVGARGSAGRDVRVVRTGWVLR